MKEFVKQYITDGGKIVVCRDYSPDNPRELFEPICKMYCFHRKYDLGDKHTFSIEQVRELAQSEEYYSLPLYLLDHSGITMSTTPFNDPWDSCKVGSIILHKKLAERYEIKDPIQLMKSEVEEYDRYLRGDVYAYEIFDQFGKVVDSCWGIYDDVDNIIKEYKDHIPSVLKFCEPSGYTKNCNVSG